MCAKYNRKFSIMIGVRPAESHKTNVLYDQIVVLRRLCGGLRVSIEKLRIISVPCCYFSASSIRLRVMKAGMR